MSLKNTKVSLLKRPEKKKKRFKFHRHKLISTIFSSVGDSFANNCQKKKKNSHRRPKNQRVSLEDDDACYHCVDDGRTGGSVTALHFLSLLYFPAISAL